MLRYLLLISVPFVFSCSRQGESAKVNVSFEDATGSFLAETATYIEPTVYKVRFFDIRLGTVSNGGPEDVITSTWVQKGCESAKSEMEIDGKMYETYIADYCTESEQADWIDLTASAAEVNAKFNMEAVSVPPASYNYLGISSCNMLNNNTSYLTTEFMADEMAESMLVNNCQASWFKTSSPIVIGEGDTADIAIKYDKSRLVRVDTADAPLTAGPNCWLSADSKKTVCDWLGGYSIRVDLKNQ